MSRNMQLQFTIYSWHGVFLDRFIFRSNFPRMRLPWECHDRARVIDWRHCVTGPELPFFSKRNHTLKIDQSVMIPWHWLSMGVACSYSLAPDLRQFPRFAYIFFALFVFVWQLFTLFGYSQQCVRCRKTCGVLNIERSLQRLTQNGPPYNDFKSREHFCVISLSAWSSSK